jgi:hypothetical protein
VRTPQLDDQLDDLLGNPVRNPLWSPPLIEKTKGPVLLVTVDELVVGLSTDLELSTQIADPLPGAEADQEAHSLFHR